MVTTSTAGRRPARRLLALLTVLALSACGDGDDRDDVAEDGTTTTTTVEDRPDEPALPGERVEIFPYEGAELMVVGVAADDTLNVRAGPGVSFEVVLELDPLARGVLATGHNRRLEGAGVWSEIRVRGRTGWANTAFLLHPGQTRDITAQLWPNPADRPRAATMLELGRVVADRRASREPRSDVVVVDGPTVGDLGEITVDVIDLGDDSVGGERLRIFADREGGGGRFVVRTVEATSLCTRGVTGDGLCT